MTAGKYLQPSTREELVKALGEMTANSVILAGGTDFMVKQRSHPVDYDMILSICKVAEMRGIEEMERDGARWLRIGAMTTHGEIAENELVKTWFQALAMACDHVGSKQIRNRGTIGGNLANASVAGDMIPVAHLFHAQLEILDKTGLTRMVPVEEFLQGVGRTVLNNQEVLLAVYLPIRNVKSCFLKLGARREVTIADISLAMSWRIQDSCFCDIEGILGAVDSKPIPLTMVNDLLGKQKMEEIDAEQLAEVLSEMIRDIRIRRTRSPRLRILECEKVYKECAVKGIVYDMLDRMKEMEGCGQK